MDTLFILSFFAGAVQVLAPDHWLPASVLAWKRRWSLGQTALFALAILGVHLSLGTVAYFVFSSLVGASVAPSRLFLLALVFVMAVTVLRMIRFSRLREVLGAGPSSNWGIFAVISLLGPCEAIVPILVKAGHIGGGYLLPFSSFVAGTALSGVVSVCAGRVLWNRPLLLPKWIGWAQKSSAVLPVAAGLALGLTVILRIA